MRDSSSSEMEPVNLHLGWIPRVSIVYTSRDQTYAPGRTGESLDSTTSHHCLDIGCLWLLLSPAFRHTLSAAMCARLIPRCDAHTEKPPQRPPARWKTIQTSSAIHMMIPIYIYIYLYIYFDISRLIKSSG